MEGKKGFFAGLIISLAFCASAQAMSATSGSSKEVLVAVSAAFVPDSLSVNDEAFVVASGLFPNSCYSWSRAEVRNISDFDHEIRSLAWVKQSGPCLMYMVQFNEEVKLGRLAAGVHRIRFLSHDDTSLEKTLVIR